ncbi:MAG: MIP family channel protein [Oscillospiraceae bacterium]|nr:MIP family channel protein [Oscillospiraceae bacterium]
MKKYIAEIIGTMVLVFMGCGSAMVLGCDPDGGHLAVAFAFGLSIVAMAYVIGNVSGCHINPAVSLGALLDKRISIGEFCGYVVAQIIGAVIGAAKLFAIVKITGITDITGGYGSNGLAGVNGSIFGGLAVEIILTFIFVLVILGVTADKSKGSVAGIVIGLSLVFVHIVGIPLTGTSVNPARSIGPALFAGGQSLIDLWVFIVGPFVGAALAALVYQIFKCKCGKDESAKEETATEEGE